MSQQPKPLEPNEVVRWRDGPRYFGLKRTALEDAIKRGDVPKPVRFGLRASGWFGWQILAHQRRLIDEVGRGRK